MTIKTALLGMLAAAGLSSPVYSTLLFDNADAPLYVTTRNDGLEGAAAYLQIGSSDVTIDQIAINAQPLQAGQLKFVIFSDVAPPGNSSGGLLFNDVVNVSSSSSLSYILSDPFSLTLLAGHYYDIGAVFSGSNIEYTYDFVSDSENGITSIVSNQNISNFDNPALAGHGASDISLRLYSPSSTTPEASTQNLLLAGISIFALVNRIRRTTQ